MAFEEHFENGVSGDKVLNTNVAFPYVNFDETDPALQLVEFTDQQAYSGTLSATIPDLTVTSPATQRDEYQPLHALHYWEGPPVTAADWDLIWYYRYTEGPRAYFGRLMFDVEAPEVGEPQGSNNSGMRHLYVGLEHNQSENTPDDWSYYAAMYEAGSSTPGTGSFTETFTPPPQDTWLKCRFQWVDGGDYSMRIENASTGAIYLDSSHPIPDGLGLGMMDFNVIRHVDLDEPGEGNGYNFQNWFDDFGGPISAPVESIGGDVEAVACTFWA